MLLLVMCYGIIKGWDQGAHHVRIPYFLGGSVLHWMMFGFLQQIRPTRKKGVVHIVFEKAHSSPVVDATVVQEERVV